MNNPTLPSQDFLIAQLSWTKATRLHIYRTIEIGKMHRILEIGCGYGDLMVELGEQTKAEIVGIDKDATSIKDIAERFKIIIAEANLLPFDSACFDVVMMNYILLWLPEPKNAIRECVRILKHGGYLAICGEPDYGGRIDYPEELSWKSIISNAIKLNHGDPFIGRKIPALLTQTDLKLVQLGDSSQPWVGEQLEESWFVERELYHWAASYIQGIDYAKMEHLELKMRREKQRMILQPSLWAIARKI